MSDLDRLAAIVKERLDASNVAGQRWRTSMSGSIANALIAAGVTMPAPDAKPCNHFPVNRMVGRKVYETRVCRTCLVECSERKPCGVCAAAAPVCGESAVIDGIEYVCERDAHDPGTGHAYTDSVGVVTWGGDQ